MRRIWWLLMAGGGIAACSRPAPLSVHAIAPERSAVAALSYRTPRYPFHSDKLDLATGVYWPIADGMGPQGDVEFFFDGQTMYLAVNQGGGVARQLRRSDSSRRASVWPAHPGDRFFVQSPSGRWLLVVDRIEPGTLKFLPDGTGAGQGWVGFHYRPES